jgi:hypothetical protein
LAAQRLTVVDWLVIDRAAMFFAGPSAMSIDVEESRCERRNKQQMKKAAGHFSLLTDVSRQPLVSGTRLGCLQDTDGGCLQIESCRTIPFPLLHPKTVCVPDISLFQLKQSVSGSASSSARPVCLARLLRLLRRVCPAEFRAVRQLDR